MNCQHLAIAVSAAFLGSLCALPHAQQAVAQSQAGAEIAYIVTAPISGVPRSPYAQWTADQRETAFGRISGFCKYLCLDKYNSIAFRDKAAAERAMAEAKVCLGACIVNHLPPDYPNVSNLSQQLRADHDRARKLGSDLPWPLPAGR